MGQWTDGWRSKAKEATVELAERKEGKRGLSRTDRKSKKRIKRTQKKLDHATAKGGTEAANEVYAKMRKRYKRKADRKAGKKS